MTELETKESTPLNTNDDEDEVEAKLASAGIVTPPDGGYGWIIVIASFFANLFVDGIIFTVGQTLLTTWEHEFHTTAMAASWAQALLGGCYLLAGPLASGLANHFGCRLVAIAGSLMVFCGFMVSVLVPALPILYLTFGIIGGIGFGLVYLPAIVIVNQYFEKRRAFALGLAVCGSGIGTTIFSQIFPFLFRLNNGNWRTFLMNVAVISLLCIVCGLFFKSPQPKEEQVEEVAKIVSEYHEALATNESTPTSYHKKRIMSLTDPQQQQKLLDEPEPFRDRLTSCDARIVDTPSEPRKRFISYCEPTETAAAGTGDDNQQSRQAQTQRFLASYRLNTAANRSALLERPFLSTLELYASKHIDKNVWSQQNVAKSISRKSVNEMNRPLSKLGIFYPGSTASLSQRAAARRKINATSEPVSQVEQQQPAEEKEKEKEHQVESGLKTVEEESDAENWKDGIRAALYSMLDLSLFSSPTFIILAISGFLTLCCLFVPFLYLGEQASKLGVSKDGQAFLLTSLGVINIVGRIICGIISDLPSVDPLVVSNVAIISGGIGTFCVPLLTQYWMYLVYTVPFALAVAAFSALRSVICVELLGLERLSNAFGLMLLFMGIAGLVGPPTAAILKDLTGNFDLSFYLMGTLLTLSGVICIPLRRISNYEQRKQRKTVSGNAKTQQQQAELEPLTKNDESGAEPATNGKTAENVKSTTDHV